MVGVRACDKVKECVRVRAWEGPRTAGRVVTRSALGPTAICTAFAHATALSMLGPPAIRTVLRSHKLYGPTCCGRVVSAMLGLYTKAL